MRIVNKRPRKNPNELLDEEFGSSSSSNVAYTGFQSSNQKRQRLSMLSVNSTRAVGCSSPSPAYLNLGDCNNVCEHCGAMFWFDERVMSSPLSKRLKYFICCRHGKVLINFPIDPPEIMRLLFTDSQFMSNIRAYNSMFSMTSFGSKIDDTVNQGSGPYVFKISGQISHWVGSLCPATGQRPRFLQMYIFDSEDDISNRLMSSSKSSTRSLSPEIITSLASVLNACNQYDPDNAFFKKLQGFHPCEITELKTDVRTFAIYGDNFYKSAIYTFEVLSAASFVNEKENLCAVETHISAKRTEISRFETEYRQVLTQYKQMTSRYTHEMQAVYSKNPISTKIYGLYIY